MGSSVRRTRLERRGCGVVSLVFLYRIESYPAHCHYSYLAIYLAVIALNVANLTARYVVFTFGSLRASQVLHRLLVDSVLRSTLR